jgi:hypothetical protein
MDTGTLEDIAALRRNFTREELALVLRNALIGWFRPQSWHYWHYVLLDTPVGGVPPLPSRRMC